MRLERINRPHRRAFKPTRSFIELATEFGLSVASLRGMMSKQKDAPKPVIKTHGNYYYDPDEFRVWMKKKVNDAPKT